VVLDEPVQPERVALILKTKYGEYWQTVYMGSEIAAKEFGVAVDHFAPEEESDYKGQIEMIHAAVEMGYQAIVLAPSDLLLLESALDYAYEQGVPVVLIDSVVGTWKYYKSYTTDNYEAGEDLGRMAVDLAGEDIKVGIISFVSGSENAIEREKGLRDYLETHEEVVIRDTMYSMSDVDLASQITDFMLNELRPPDVLIGLNAISTLGIAKEVSKYPEDEQIIVLGFDSTPQEIEFLETGAIDNAIVQNPFNMGYLGVAAAKDAIRDSRLVAVENKDNKVETVIISEDNLYDPENEKLVFPFN
jgi:ribose transport system substrate-binding protein